MEVLPENYYKAEHVGGVGNDKQFILDNLKEVTYKQRLTAADKYSTIFLGEGRSAANTRLREFVKKCKFKNNGCTIELETI